MGEEMMMKKQLFLLILLIMLNSVFGFQKVDESNLDDILKNQVRKDVISGLVINIFFKYYSNNKNYQSSFPESQLLNNFSDSNTVHRVRIESMEEKIIIGEVKYNLYKYELTNKIKYAGDPKKTLFALDGPFREIYNYDINKLFQIGIYAVSEDREIIFKYNDERHCIQRNDSSFVGLEEKIKLLYFHYLPENVKLDIKNSTFNFYSLSLNRYFNGVIENYSRPYIYLYSLELVNGVLR